MNLKKSINLFSLCFLLFLSSCSKTIENNHWQAEISENNINSLPELFSQIGSEKLIDIVASKDSLKASSYNIMKANQIASYFYDKYKIDIREKFEDNPEGIVILGKFYAEKEYQNSKNQIKSNSLKSFKTGDENMGCFITVIGDVIGISQAKAIWNSIVLGASEETVIAAISLIGKRVAGVLTVATMIYSTGSCLEWW